MSILSPFNENPCLKKLTLPKIIFFGFLMIITFVSVVFFVGLWNVYQHNKVLKEAALSRGLKVAIVSDMLSTTFSRSQATFLLYSRGYKNFSLFDERYQESTIRFQDAIDRLKELGCSVEQEKLIENILLHSQKVNVAQAYLYNYFSLYEDENPQPGFSPDEIVILYESLDREIKNLLEYEQAAWFREVSNNIEYSEKLYKIGFAVFLLAFFVCGYIAFKVMGVANSAEKRLLRQTEYAQATLISISDGVITVNSKGFVKHINKTAQELTGFSEENAVGEHLSKIYLARSIKNNFLINHPASHPAESVDVGFHSTHYLESKLGGICEVDSSYSVVKNDNRVAGAVIIFRDITESREMSRKLEWQASHDALTGLINRNAFEEKIHKTIEIVKGSEEEYALLFIDLDQFKVVNDTCGHVAGDELLSQVGVIFKEHLRKTDTLARLGGDEFGILLSNCNDELAYIVANKLLKSISEFRFVWEDKVFFVGASIGFVIIDESAVSLSELMSAADMACYAAKESGRGRVKKYNNEVSESATAMSMSSMITQSLDNDSFELFFQDINPVADGPSEKICEVLIRMNTNDGVLLPNSFLPAAERYNLMCNIDRWVINNVLAYISQSLSLARDYQYDKYCINLSGESINDESFFEFLKETVSLYQVPTHYLSFEITETVAITNLSNAAKLINQIRALGCSLSLDDFGTGASSFAYLKYLAVDTIKIDGTFIKDLIDDPVDLEIVRSIVNIAKVLEVKTVAEFVETKELLDKVRELGIDYAQGYYINRPEVLPDLSLS